ncbi:MAG TPA: galactokinase [Candidatus Limnocylindrales bacterium]
MQVARAPGRVNLIGEYTDFNLGYVLPAAIDREIRIAFVPADDRHVILHRTDTGERTEFDLDRLPERTGSWSDYAVATAWAMAAAGLELHGLRGVIGSNLPTGAGLSSSAAIELAVAQALHAGGTDKPEPMDLARIAQRAENGFVGVQSGLMDQFAVACGRADAALLLDCRSLEWRPVALPLERLTLVVCDSGQARSLAGSEYNVRRAQCDAAVAALATHEPAIHSLRDVSVELIGEAAARGWLDAVVLRRATHVVHENERVLEAIQAFEAADLPAIGRLFAASHASLRDLFEVSSPALDALVEIASSTPGVVAARMTGAGFGGCTINLVRPDAVDDLRAAVESRYAARTGFSPRVFPVTPAAGSGLMAA